MWMIGADYSNSSTPEVQNVDKSPARAQPIANQRRMRANSSARKRDVKPLPEAATCSGVPTQTT